MPETTSIGPVVHRATISVAGARQERGGELRHRGTVVHRPDHARGRGCRQPHAMRILGRARLRVLRRSWQDRKPCDPARYGAARAMR